MATNQTRSREDIEIAIETCKEEIYEQKHKIRWFLWGLRVFWLGIAIGIVVFAVIFPFNVPYLQSLFAPVGGIALILAFILGFVLGGTYYEDKSIGRHLNEIRQEKRTLAKLLRQLAYVDEQSLRHLSPEQYMYQVPILIKSYRKRADRYRRWFTTISIITILLSAAITSLSGGWLDKYVSIPWIIPVCSALISILTSLTLFFKFREKGANLQQSADMMDWEHMACTLGIGIYKGLAREDKLTLLAERTEALRKEQQQKQLQLEQSSHAEQKALQSNA